MAEMKKLIPKNDYVRNKDRQDPIAVLKLSDDKLVNQLSKVGYIVHTIIPETTKYTKKNKVGMYTNPIDICIGPYGYLFMITYDDVKMESKIFKVQLHNPVEKIEFLKLVKGRQIYYRGGRLFYFEPKAQPFFLSIKSKNVNKMRSKDGIVAYAKPCTLKAEKNRCTLKQVKFHVNQHLERNKQEYTSNGFLDTCINVPGKPCFDSVCFSDDDTTNIFATNCSRREIVKIDTKFDGYDLILINFREISDSGFYDDSKSFLNFLCM